MSESATEKSILAKLDHLIESTSGLLAASKKSNPDPFWVGNLHYELQIDAWKWAREIVVEEFDLASAADERPSAGALRNQANMKP